MRAVHPASAVCDTRKNNKFSESRTGDSRIARKIRTSKQRSTNFVGVGDISPIRGNVAKRQKGNGEAVTSTTRGRTGRPSLRPTRVTNV